MNKTSTIIRYTFIANLRNRIALILVGFGGVLLGCSILLGLLSQEEAIRVLMDFGLSAIEFLAFLTSVFLIIQLLLEEIESRTIYLVLTRSTNRFQYLFGRFAGTLASVLVCVFVMTLIHSILLLLKGWSFEEQGFLYLLSIFMSFEKIVIISAVGLFFSLFSSSSVVALIFTFFTWILGHFAMELKFLASEIKAEWMRVLFKGIYHGIPHFQYLNARDLWLTVSDQMPRFLFQGIVFTAVYSSAFFILAFLAFHKKEF